MLSTCIFWDKTWDCLASKWKDSGGNLSDVCKCLMGGRKEDGARLFSWISCERTKGNGHKWKYRKFHLKLRIFFTVRVVKRWHRLPRVDVESLSLEIPKPHRPWTWKTFSSWSCTSRGLEPQVPFSLPHSMVQRHWAEKPVILVLFPAILVYFKAVFLFPMRN